MNDAEIKSLVYSMGTVVELQQPGTHGTEAFTLVRNRLSNDVHITMSRPDTGAHTMLVRLADLKNMIAMIERAE